MRYLIFDIETIPQPKLDTVLEELVTRRTDREVDKGRLERSDAESLVRSISPYLGRVLAIGMRFYNAHTEELKDKVICEESEVATLQKFIDIIDHQASRDLRFVHYNGLGFDVPFIIIRAMHHGIDIQNRRFLNLRRFSFSDQIDVMQFLTNWGREFISLDAVCHSFGIPSPKEGEVQGNTVAEAYRAGNLEAVEEYVMRDVEATHALFKKISPYLH